MNLSKLISLVIASTKFSLVYIIDMFTLPSSTTSYTKWYFTPMCFVLEWNVGFFGMCMTLWLLEDKIIFYFLCPSSSISLFYPNICNDLLYFDNKCPFENLHDLIFNMGIVPKTIDFSSGPSDVVPLDTGNCTSCIFNNHS